MIGLFVLLTALLFWGAQIVVADCRESVGQAKGNIDDAFQKRFDVLSKIYETTKGYIKFKENEMETLANLFSSLKNPAPGFREKLKLQNHLKNILISSIGDLRDDQTGEQFKLLNQSINDVEENLSAARRFYNHSVKEYNTSIRTFPASVIARFKGLQAENYFEVENEDVRKDIEIKF